MVQSSDERMQHKGQIMYLCRFYRPGAGARIGLVHSAMLYDVSARWPSISAFLQWSVGRTDIAPLLEQVVAAAEAIAPLAEVDREPSPDAFHLLKPVDEQEIWAAGVTYERSRVAREEESAGSGIYDRVYTAPRPEIFFKATPSRTVGPYMPVAVRSDSAWNVPEPELALVVNPAMELVGFTIGNDMSSRDIEGENPLYLPQAKMYGRCCALGPLIALSGTLPNPRDLAITLRIERHGQQIFEGTISTSKIVREYQQLIGYLGRDNLFPEGAALLTGTGIVPPDSISIDAGDIVRITIEGIGTLVNPVVRGGV
jgi:2-dehydro-3-deoxy-D-arabinonate dehydratase